MIPFFNSLLTHVMPRWSHSMEAKPDISPGQPRITLYLKFWVQALLRVLMGTVFGFLNTIAIQLTVMLSTSIVTLRQVLVGLSSTVPYGMDPPHQALPPPQMPLQQISLPTSSIPHTRSFVTALQRMRAHFQLVCRSLIKVQLRIRRVCSTLLRTFPSTLYSTVEAHPVPFQASTRSCATLVRDNVLPTLLRFGSRLIRCLCNSRMLLMAHY